MATASAPFTVGQTVNIVENGKTIDRAIIRRVGRGGDPPGDELLVESLDRRPGAQTEFASIGTCAPIGWRVLFADPFTGRRCFSQRAPAYEIVPA